MPGNNKSILCPVTAHVTAREMWPACNAEMIVTVDKRWRKNLDLNEGDIVAIGLAAKCCDCTTSSEVYCKHCKGPGGKVLLLGAKESYTPRQNEYQEEYCFVIKQFCTSSKSHLKQLEVQILLDFGRGHVISTGRFRLVTRQYNKATPRTLIEAAVLPCIRPHTYDCESSPPSCDSRTPCGTPISPPTSFLPSISIPPSLPETHKFPPLVVRLLAMSAHSSHSNIHLTEVAQSAVNQAGGTLTGLFPVSSYNTQNGHGPKCCVTLVKYKSLQDGITGMRMFDSLIPALCESLSSLVICLGVFTSW
ncbi:hypothetical protein Pelo_2300 [Pelomyxa schiedti]|nr:hypothetical protein Pelo_2300 [Pelomyxa schiedti]